MPNGPVLELSTLPERHPKTGEALLHVCAAPVMIRLHLDPTPQPVGTMKRDVSVNWITRPGTDPAVSVNRCIGWQGLPPIYTRLCVSTPISFNAQDITEWAAIGVMALLIHDLEGVRIKSVLQIGSGGDYLVLLEDGRKRLQVEVSGIHQDGTGLDSELRRAKKSKQVRTHGDAGYISVTTFAHLVGRTVHSYLHYVGQIPKKKKGAKKGKRK